jgi:plasmid stability protein
MPKMIQIRNVPEALHRRMKARAAAAGMSLSDYLLAEVRRVADRPTPEELWQRLRTREPVVTQVSAAEAVRQESRLPLIVVDASALIEVLLLSELGVVAGERLFVPDTSLHGSDHSAPQSLG